MYAKCEEELVNEKFEMIGKRYDTGSTSSKHFASCARRFLTRGADFLEIVGHKVQKVQKQHKT